MENLTSLLATIIASIVTMLVTYYFTIRANISKENREIRKEQKFRYYFPFKHQCDELYHRLLHIEKGYHMNKEFPNKKNEVVMRQFEQNFEEKNLKFFLTNWYQDNSLNSGQFLISTLYMHCALYSKIRLLQNEYPYLTVRVKRSLRNLINEDENAEQLQRCIDSSNSGRANRQNNFIQKLLDLEGKKIVLIDIIKIIRLSLAHKLGIPYSLQLSLGNYIEKENGILNFDEFCKELLDDEKRTKFLPLIEFWDFTDKNTLSKKIISIHTLILGLKLIELTELK